MRRQTADRHAQRVKMIPGRRAGLHRIHNADIILVGLVVLPSELMRRVCVVPSELMCRVRDVKLIFGCHDEFARNHGKSLQESVEKATEQLGPPNVTAGARNSFNFPCLVCTGSITPTLS